MAGVPFTTPTVHCTKDSGKMGSSTGVAYLYNTQVMHGWDSGSKTDLQKKIQEGNLMLRVDCNFKSMTCW